MIRLIFLLTLGLGCYLLWRYLIAVPPEKRRSVYLKVGLWSLVVVALLLAATGRMHWVGAALTAMLLVIRQSLPILLKTFPILHQLVKNRNSEQGRQATPPSQTAMDESEALATLGLEAGASEADIIAAHRKLMQKLHPDRDGNDYLAAKINQAKDCLLG